MTSEPIDVLGIGNAIVDVLTRTDEDFLVRHDLIKAAMTLIDEERAETLYSAMGPGIECSGGSAGNTIAGVASLGGRAAYIGKVRDDDLGRIFGHDIRAQGVEFTTPPATAGARTARCLVVVTPDAQRTMNTYLGACVGLTPDDIDDAQVARAQVTYMEGYLWDPPKAKDAFRKAMKVARAAGRKTSLTLSDSFCVSRWRDEFLDLCRHSIDILFANEQEICALIGSDDFDHSVRAARDFGILTVLTRSEKGSVIVTPDAIHQVAAEPIAQVVDTTGAGDLYAAGFLYGHTNGYSLPDCGRIASICAAEVIAQLGARPQTSLSRLVKERLGK